MRNTGLKKSRVIFVLAWMSVIVCAEVNGEARTREPLCDNWTFQLGDVKGAEKPQFDDGAWRTLDVPHDWSIELPFDKSLQGGSSVGYLPGGIGWYRKTFTVPESSQGKKIVIDFDGVYMDSQVWINGHLLGRRPSGYVSFQYDLTPYLNFGKENIIAVRANVEPNGSRWYPGAGIYRRVWLTTLNPVHVKHWGTYVTTPTVSKTSATVLLQTEVSNVTSKNVAATLKSVIVDAAGAEVAKAESEQKVAAGQTGAFEQKFRVLNPTLWSPDTPNMYQVKTQVVVRGQVVDETTTPLGIRTCEFTKDKGFFLNGEHVDIKGVCLHHDFGPIGTAFYPRALEHQLEILQEMGCNAIRTAHNPRDPEFYNICDRMGFMVMNEAFDVWMQKKLPNDFHQFFDEWHERDLTDMVRRDRNHPSIIIWSIGNEMNEQHREDFPGQGGVIATRLVEIVKKHDASRAITSACNSYKASVEKGMVEPLDVYGQNYGMSQFPEIRKGGKPVIGTENATSFITRGSYSYEIVNDRGIKLSIQNIKNNSECTGYGKFWGADRTDGTLIEIRKNPWVAGQFAWTGFDYIGECFPFPWPARNGLFGIIDMVGFPKDSYYAYQSDWTDKPMVHLVPQNWNWMQFSGKPIPVWVYSNCDEVELFLNNASLGVKKINRTESLHAEWNVPYKPGELKAVARKGGKIVATQIIRTAEEAARLELSADRMEIAADGSDLSFIEVKLVDENGVFCPDADLMVQVKVEGNGELLGVGNGSALNHSPFTGSQVQTFYGLCRVIVKSTRKDGAIKVSVSADGVEAAQVEIKTLRVDNPLLQKERAEKAARVAAENKTYSRHRIAFADTERVPNEKPGPAAKASASSSETGHPPEHAIDGNPQTRWSPKDGNPGHVWQVDLGGPHDVRGIKILWQVTTAYQYKVEGSADGKNWGMLSDQTKRTAAGSPHQLNFNQSGIRYVRIVTTGLPKDLWGSFYEVEVIGKPAAQVAEAATGKMTVAPVFKHGTGQFADSVIVSRNKKPPVWSESAARKVVIEEAKRLGLELTVSGKKPRVSGIRATRDGNAGKIPADTAITMEFDGVSKDGKIVFEVLTAQDVPDRTDNTDHVTDFFAAAKKLVAELDGKPGGYIVGVFYDPMEGKGTEPNDEPLRRQVRDFVQWLKK
jgi:beta-galactosidase